MAFLYQPSAVFTNDSASRFGIAHPFCRKELLTDGKMVFLENEEGAEHMRLQEVLTGQGVFSHIIHPFLQTIDYDTAELLAVVADCRGRCDRPRFFLWTAYRSTIQYCNGCFGRRLLRQPER